MAFNPSPKVADCRDIARKWNCQQVVIVGIDLRGEKFEVASYGETASLCADAKRLNERIAKVIETDDY